MFKLQYPWALLIVFLPLLVMLLKRQDLMQLKALKVPHFKDIQALGNSYITQTSSIVAKIIAFIIWVLLSVALACPLWVDEPIELPRKGRDILLAIDISGSMETPDMFVNKNAVDRLSVVKEVATKFVDQRSGDRLGLILFGSKAYLQTPLTFDRKTVKHMIDDATIKLAGPLTAIGDAIGLAVKRLRNIESESKVLVLLTDGANNAGAVNPIKAAKMAKDFEIKIYTIGLGADELKVPGFFGPQLVNPSQDLDEKTLKEISEITEGVFFRAKDTSGLEEVYQTIDKLEPNEKESGVYRPRYELFHWPLGIAIILSFLLLVRKITPLQRWI